MRVQHILRNVARSIRRARRTTVSHGKVNSRDRFQQFTQRARQVMHFAQEEALRFQHNYIGTEHLLLGLIREGEGVAAKVLKSFDVDLEKIRQAVEQIIGRGRGDRPVVSGEVGLTPRAKKVIELAVDEAHSLNHHYIGTEHLLLGLLREGQGIGAGTLESFGLSLQQVRAKVIQMLNEDRLPMRMCSFCGKQQDRVQRLIAGPGNVSVCDECIAAFSRPPDESQEKQGLRCSFCGKKQGQVLHLTLGPQGVNICSECVVLCQQIIAEEHPPQD